MIRTARITGLLYLGLAISGMFGFLVTRPRLFADGDPAATLANLTGQPRLATALVVFELLIVVTQALTAAWFYRLFRTGDPVSAAGIGAGGLINSVLILASAAMLATAVAIAGDPFGDAASTVQLLFLISGELWAVGAVFFGLWLIPMGTAVLRTRLMPPVLGWILVASGIGYLLNAFTGFAPLTYLATIGEFWIIGYLLTVGVRRTAEPTAPVSADSHGDDVRPTPDGDSDVVAAAEVESRRRKTEAGTTTP